MRYSCVYNGFMGLVMHPGCSPERSEALSVAWMMRHCHERRPWHVRLQFLRHVLHMHRTQFVGARVPLVPMAVTLERTLTLGWIMLRLRPLQRRVLEYLWRPNGPLAWRHVLHPLADAPWTLTERSSHD